MHSGIRRLLAMATLGAACGAPTDPVGELPNGSGPDGLPPPAADGGERLTELRIPRIELPEASLYGGPIPQDDGRFVMESNVVLAVGEGYPETFTAVFPSTIFGACGRLEWDVVLTDVERPNPTLAVELVTTGLRIIVDAPGSESMVVRGEATLREAACDRPEGAVVSIEMPLYIDLRAVGGSRIVTACEDPQAPLVLAPGQPFLADLRRPQVELVDVEGAVFRADNAAGTAQDDLVIRGDLDPSSAESLQEWVAPSIPGPLTIESRLGDVLEVEVAGPQDILRAEVEFQIGHVKAQPSPLENGADYSYDELVANSSAPTTEVMPRVAFLDAPSGRLCSPPPPAWFELVSSTPDVCAAGPTGEGGPGGFQIDGGYVGQGATLLNDGTCRLELRAPDLAPDAQFPVRFTATFREVDRFFGW